MAGRLAAEGGQGNEGGGRTQGVLALRAAQGVCLLGFLWQGTVWVMEEANEGNNLVSAWSVCQMKWQKGLVTSKNTEVSMG